MTFSTFLGNTSSAIQKNAPALLTALTIAGVGTTAYLAHEAGAQAKELIPVDGTTFKEKLKATWRVYLPPVLTGAATISCAIAAQTVNARRNAALMGAVTLSETAFREYRDKVVEVAGKAKEKKVVESLAQDKVDKAEGSEVIFVGDDKYLCFDTLTGRFFSSTETEIRKQEVELNRQILNEMYASQNEWYDFIGLPRVASGDDLGWNNDYPLEIQIDGGFKEGKPVAMISYRHRPFVNFHRFG